MGIKQIQYRLAGTFNSCPIESLGAARLSQFHDLRCSFGREIYDDVAISAPDRRHGEAGLRAAIE